MQPNPHSRTHAHISLYFHLFTGLKCGLDYHTPGARMPAGQLAVAPKVVLGAFNSTAMAGHVARYTQVFDRLYQRRAFCHWYTDAGMEEAEFNEAREDLALLEGDYDEVTISDSGEQSDGEDY